MVTRLDLSRKLDLQWASRPIVPATLAIPKLAKNESRSRDSTIDEKGDAIGIYSRLEVRVVFPRTTFQLPIRITSRYLLRERLIHSLPLIKENVCEAGPHL